MQDKSGRRGRLYQVVVGKAWSAADVEAEASLVDLLVRADHGAVFDLGGGYLAEGSFHA
jgi:hypothetical protein